MLKTLDTISPDQQNKLTEMIENLCKEHGINFSWTYTMDNRADHINRAVRLKRIQHFYQFASCLHEIGHLLSKQTADILENEYRAWEWARNWAQSRQHFDRSCYARIAESLGRYVRESKNEIPADHPALVLLEEAEKVSR